MKKHNSLDKPFPKTTLLKAKALEQRISFDAAAISEAIDVFSGDSENNDDTTAQDNTEYLHIETPTFAENEIIIIDASISGYEKIIQNIPNNPNIYILNSTQDGLTQITDIINSQNSLITGIHIFSHGDAGIIQLGDSLYNNNNILSYKSLLNSWQDSLSNDADILLYGCNIAGTDAGKDFIDNFSMLTGADILASDDITGNAEQYGDWVLEIEIGDVETKNIIQTHSIDNYTFTLALDTPITETEILVNTETTNNQSAANITTLESGDFVVTWQSNAQDGSGNGIYGQIFNQSGQKIGNEFQINQQTSNEQTNAEVSALNNGGFIVTWASLGQDGDGSGIYARLYNADYTNYGNEFLVNSTTTNDQTTPNVATLANGRIIVTWQSDDSDGSGIFAQILTFTGNKVGSEFQVNSSETNNQQNADVISLQDGGFVITWDTSHNGTNDVAYQRYDASGNAVGEEIIVNTTTADTQYETQVTQLEGGNIIFTWTSDSAEADIYYRVYDSNFIAQTGELIANMITAGDQSQPSIVGLSDGGFYIFWQSDNGDDGDSSGIIGRQFDSDGTARGNQFVANFTTSGAQTILAGKDSAAQLQNGNIAIQYQSGGDIYCRIISPEINLSPEVNTVNITLSALTENSSATITNVSSLITSASITDAEGATTGIAVTGFIGEGIWEYSLDGGTNWNKFGNISESSATLLSNTAKIRFTPQTESNGTASLSFKAWDQTTGSNGDRFTNTSISSNFNAFSTVLATASHAISAVNDAPIINNAADVVMNSIRNGDDTNNGQTVAALFQNLFSDNDSGSLTGIAIIGSVNLPSEGNWLFSTDGGNTWQNLSNLSDSNAVVLRQSDLIKYAPTTGFSGQPGALSVRLFDGSAGSFGTSQNISAQIGGTGAFSNATQNVQIDVLSPLSIIPDGNLVQDFTFFQNTRQSVIDLSNPLDIKNSQKSLPSSATQFANLEGSDQSPIMTFYDFNFDIFSQEIESSNTEDHNQIELELNDKQHQKTLLPEAVDNEFEDEIDENALPKPSILEHNGSLSFSEQIERSNQKAPLPFTESIFQNKDKD